ncbi:MAG: hypothetical protein WAL52_04030 [Candidatus Sulfotelmatobacter sp.]
MSRGPTPPDNVCFAFEQTAFLVYTLDLEHLQENLWSSDFEFT